MELTKTKYKQTEIGLIPEDWEVRKLGEVSESYSGGTPSTSNAEYYNGNIHWISSGELNQNRIKVTKEFITNKGLNNSSAKMVKKGDLLVAMYGATAGISAITEINGAINQAVLAILPINNNVEYLFHYFKLNKQNIIDTYTQGGQPNLSGGIIKKIKIPLPPLPEQKAIAEVLSDVDFLIQAIEQKLAKKRAIKQGAMQKLLTPPSRTSGQGKENWEVKKLGEIAYIEMGQSPSSDNYNTNGIGLPLVQGNADINNRQTIIRNYTSQITKKCIKDDIIMSVRAPVGEIATATQNACIGRGVCAIRYPNKYLFHYLIFIEPRWAKLSTGSTFDSVNSDTIKNLEIPFPPKEEQISIANILSDMDKEIELIEKQLAKYQTLKQGLMQELLTGRIRLV